MNKALRLVLPLCIGAALAACAPKPHLTQKQIESMAGKTMDAVKRSIGGPYVVTNAGDSVWWDYNNIIMPDGTKDGTCQLVFVHDVVKEVKC